MIEVMVAVAIIAILVAIALPSYNDYIRRAQIIEGTNALSILRANMERHYQDNRKYTTQGAFKSPCAASSSAGTFSISCPTLTDSAFTAQAVGSGATAGLAYTIDQQNTRATSAAPMGWIPGAMVCDSAWIIKRGQPCPAA